MTKFKRLLVVLTVVSFMMSAAVLMGSPEPIGNPKAEGVRVNINTAGVDQLMQLPRIGPKIAKRIVDFRTKHGKFKRPHDLMKVKGIGEKTFKRFANQIVVGKTKKTKKTKRTKKTKKSKNSKEGGEAGK